MRVRPIPVLAAVGAALLVIALGAYAAALSSLYLKQRDYLYAPRQQQRTQPAAAGLTAAEEVVLTTADGEKVIAWHVPPQAQRPLVVFFHGNGDSLAGRAWRFRQLIADGTGLLALSYRGYAGSTGLPSEDGLLLDAAAAYNFAAARHAPERIVVWGFSLGTGPAVAIASQRPVGKLVLEAPYTSTVDVAAAMFPYVPVRLLMKDQFRSDQRISTVTAPLLLLHGERDSVIAIAFGERLYELARGPKRFVRFPDGDHDNLDRLGVVEVVRAFIYGPPP
jgi:fermentation-respiration switch protein FrsA (DUF1100 family)